MLRKHRREKAKTAPLPGLHLYQVAECMIAAVHPPDAVNLYYEYWGFLPNQNCQLIPDDCQVSISFDRRPNSREIPADAYMEPLEYGKFRITAPAAAWAALGRQLLSIDSDCI